MAAATMKQPETNISDLYAKLKITQQTLDRHVGPDGSLREAGQRLIQQATVKKGAQAGNGLTLSSGASGEGNTMIDERQGFLPLETELKTAVVLLVVSVSLLSLFSQLEIPIGPVPITAQSFMVVAVGAIMGPMLGTAAVVAWLACGAAGLPVLAGGSSGLSHFGGPTAGFIFAFPIATLTTGWLVSHRRTSEALLRAGWVFYVGVIAHVICLGLGVIWLSMTIGFSSALENGFYPFIPGGIIKSAAVVMLVLVIERSLQQRVD